MPLRRNGLPGMIYGRRGYGASDPRPLPWPADVLEQEATIVLPALLDAIVTAVAGPAERVLIPDCVHDPHHQARAAVVERMAAFVRALGSGEGAIAPQHAPDPAKSAGA